MVAPLGELVSLVVFLALLVGPGLLAAVVWSPFLLSSRLRGLFGRLPPFDSPYGTYVLAAVLGTFPYLFGFLLAIAGVDASGPSGGARLANATVDLVVPLTLCYVVGGPVLAGAVLPRVGVDWDPNGYDAWTWTLLLAGSGWYALVLAAPFCFVAFAAALPT